jgi:beta-glucosidase
MMAEARMVFPPDFLWGTATSSHQVEGNNKNNDWWAWEQTNGRSPTATYQSGLACNWWENAEADLDAAAAMGVRAHRISIEWSRVEPEPSVFNDRALERYRAILAAMHERGIEPMVALHHFTNPRWLVEKGDFNVDLVVEYFRRYTTKVVSALGDLVPKWLTFNEPMVYVFMRYVAREFPTGNRQGFGAAYQAIENLLRCHAAAYHTIKELFPTAQVSMAKSMQVFAAPPESGALNKWWAKQVSWVFNDLWLESMASGRLKRPLAPAHPIPHLANTFDFLAINYYTRFYVPFPPGRNFIQRDWGDNAIISDGEYGEVYPAGLYQCIHRVTRYNKPIYITENGLPDQTDRLRPAFILAHLREVWRAISFSFPVMGYYHWSLIDNFEWHNGWTQRFGLIEMDPSTQARQWRKSAHLYQEICQTNSINSDMAKRYAPELLATMFPGAAPERSRE